MKPQHVIHDDGTQEWILNGNLHRTDGPAIISSYGYQAWFINNKLHRSDGPAFIDSNGTKRYYLYGDNVDISGDFDSPEFQKQWKRILKTMVMR